MTDRISALTVALDEDVREDDVQPLIDAILRLRGVSNVTAHVVQTGDYVARSRVGVEMRKALLKAIKDIEAGA